MEAVINHKLEVANTYNCVKDISFKHKKEALNTENRINQFLDSILIIKDFLKDKATTIQLIINKCESLTWYTDLYDDEEALNQINSIIALSKEWHSNLNKLYVSFDVFRKKGIAKEELKQFKQAINDLKEMYTDLNDIFFVLPYSKEFQSITASLEKL